MILAAPMAINAPTGTSTPTELANDGTSKNNTTMNNSGAMDSFQFLLTYTTASPPNKAGKILSKAGLTTGLSKIGVSGTSRATPKAIMMVVTMDEVPTARVEITSPSSLPGFTFAFSMAFNAAGTFRLVKFPVTTAR